MGALQRSPMRVLPKVPSFRVREMPDWEKHAADLDAEMLRHGMIFEVIDWSEDQATLPFAWQIARTSVTRLNPVRRPRDTPIWKREAALKCRFCEQGRGIPAFGTHDQARDHAPGYAIFRFSMTFRKSVASSA
jgi:hypothetical protein